MTSEDSGVQSAASRRGDGEQNHGHVMLGPTGCQSGNGYSTGTAATRLLGRENLQWFVQYLRQISI